MNNMTRICGIIGIAVIVIANSPVLARDTFEIEVGYEFVGPIRLKDGRFLAVMRGLKALHSSDGGRTWAERESLIKDKDRKFRRGLIRPFSFIRLQSGALAINYWQRLPRSELGLARERCMFIKSTDDGESWGEPVQVTWPHTPAYPQWMIQTKTGRLVLANEYWYEHKGSDTGVGICTALYSDDEGQTWQESNDGLILRHPGGAIFDTLAVPCIAQTRDGRLLMFMRNEVGRIAKSYSDDEGQYWSLPVLTDLVSSNAELWLSTIPTTGDLLCVWNQASTQEIKDRLYRSRLTSAISKDNGKTWEHFRTLAMSPGQKQISRIVNPDPPAYLKSPGIVPPRELIADKGTHHVNTFPRVKFVDNTVYLVYNHRVYEYPEGAARWKRSYNSRLLRVFPIEWFYGQD